VESDFLMRETTVFFRLPLSLLSIRVPLIEWVWENADMANARQKNSPVRNFLIAGAIGKLDANFSRIHNKAKPLILILS
jgi:hypothetical protein